MTVSPALWVARGGDWSMATSAGMGVLWAAGKHTGDCIAMRSLAF